MRFPMCSPGIGDRNLRRDASCAGSGLGRVTLERKRGDDRHVRATVILLHHWCNADASYLLVMRISPMIVQ
jgi:hypothetical protein